MSLGIPWPLWNVIDALPDAVLTGNHKRFILKVAGFDQGPDHAYATLPRFAEMLGLGLKRTKELSADVQDWGLVRRAGKGLIVCVPDEYRPQSKRPSHAAITELARNLAEYVRSRQRETGAGGRPSVAGEAGAPERPRPETKTGAPGRPEGELRDGAPGRPDHARAPLPSPYLPSPEKGENLPPLSPPLSEKGPEKGEVVHDQDEKGDAANTGWQAFEELRETLAPLSQRKRIRPAQPTRLDGAVVGEAVQAITAASNPSVSPAPGPPAVTPAPDDAAATALPSCPIHDTALERRWDGTEYCISCELQAALG